MARLFPFRSEPAENEGHPRIVDLEGEDADAVFSALSSTTARQIYARLENEPGTPSDVADAIDSSIQNVRYHLENLEEAGLIEVVDTWYSSRGNEMSVYAATDGPLIVTSDDSTASRLREALSRFVGGLGALAGGSLLVQHGLTRWAESATDSSAAEAAPAGVEDGDDAGEPDDVDDSSADEDEASGFETETTDSDEAEDEAETAEDADADADADAADDVALDSDPSATGADSTEHATDGSVEAAEAVFATIPPGLLFFFGGLVVLTLATLYWYWYRPAY
ncbi:helix-turn-helix domain-containing protein [Natronorubrum sp. JWXQ-INN-674]|uniref:Helix-turn-helix domain-containing protein n=1 Tax=Natronorubrum halalkaliphilum TaxID=2691917 RepID=A0A6B0VSG1_9EURY|nr:helix-turn-helix domain-containing protein [Natronorubrum halalkaliphilum]MXV64478.1 helix-turn-helix domain-containing protein [Natronorubrum halalkaliphilum]